MKTDRWNLIEEIFQGALERPSSDRHNFVVRACGDDPELRHEIESLLANESDAGTVLDSVVVSDLRRMMEDTVASEAGLRLGPYRLVRELDSGGMGVVYLGVRADDQYFQIVAIKLIRKGLETPELVQRFRAERQILASLSHPNIGTILDGGETPDGRPYIVMEYVEGRPITLACESSGQSTRQRVDLFRSVCSAVHYAHQKLVIHRDIKPSNVLVTPEGVVKLIDFGVSKPVEPELMPLLFPKTLDGQRLLTPDYASPEQLQGKELTTATDIYSLGVLLFELLTGSRPYSLSGVSPATAERIVCDEQVAKPSSVRGLSEQTRRELQGDLDNIVLKAMEKDPSRRYRSAQHFEEDLSRFLQGRPVVAREPTPIYRLGKFIQRHRTAVMMGVTIALVLGGALLFHQRQSRTADRRVKQVETLANSAISDLSAKLERSSGSTEPQASMFQSALDYLERLRQSSGNDPRLLLELSKAYARVGDLRGSPFVANLGDSGTAVRSYQESLRTAIEARDRLPGEESTIALIEACHRLGGIESFLGNVKEARDEYEKSLSLARDFSRQKPDDPVRKRLLALSYAGIGDVQLISLEPDKALENFRESFRIFGDAPNGTEEHDRTLISLHLRLARALNELGPQQEALANARQAIALSEDLTHRFPSSRPLKRLLFTGYEYITQPLVGRDMMNVGDSNRGQIYARKGLELAEAIAASDDKNIQARYDVSLAYTTMGDALSSVQPNRAAEWYWKSIVLSKELAPTYGAEARHWLAIRDEALAQILVDPDHAQERLELLQEANQIRQDLAKTSLHGRLHLMGSYCMLSDAELGVGNVSQARAYADKALPFLDEFTPASQSLLVLRDIGRCYESIGNVQRQIAMGAHGAAPERAAARADARLWYAKSVDVWDAWRRRGASTPESEFERRKVLRSLRQIK
jgi:eukaryotic-like serine/threonine-protein kinase